MKSQLYIPQKVRVGFKDGRKETVNGKIAFIIPYEKGKLRSEKSFEEWRNKEIEAYDIENEPSDGFVINKAINRYSHWSGSVNKTRVYDEKRGVEFEITFDNLLSILDTNDLNKKCLSGDYVYAWFGKDLVLLPTNSEEYINSVKFTDLRTKKIGVKDLVLFGVYETKKQEIYTYLGKHEINTKKNKDDIGIKRDEGTSKDYKNYEYYFNATKEQNDKIISDGFHDEFYNSREVFYIFLDKNLNYIRLKNLDGIARFLHQNEDKEWCGIEYEKFLNSKYHQKIAGFEIVKKELEFNDYGGLKKKDEKTDGRFYGFKDNVLFSRNLYWTHGNGNERTYKYEIDHQKNLLGFEVLDNRFYFGYNKGKNKKTFFDPKLNRLVRRNFIYQKPNDEKVYALQEERVDDYVKGHLLVRDPDNLMIEKHNKNPYHLKWGGKENEFYMNNPDLLKTTMSREELMDTLDSEVLGDLRIKLENGVVVPIEKFYLPEIGKIYSEDFISHYGFI